jgi:hypothetical protein
MFERFICQIIFSQRMKKLLTLLIIMITPFSKAETPKLGSDGDPIRQALFACQQMKELLQHVKLDGSPGPFQTIAEAAKLADEGKKEDARLRLHGILALPNLETRIQLWVWSALRELGEQPDPKLAGEILGVVIEVPMQGAYDTLAAYQDGSARYLNFSGSAIIWDRPDTAVSGLCRAFIDSTVPASSQAKLRANALLPKSGMQVTLLTRSGMSVVSDPPEPIVKAGAALMMELMRRAKEKKG